MYTDTTIVVLQDKLWLLAFKGTDSIEILPFVSFMWGRGCLCPGQILISLYWLTFGIQITYDRKAYLF